MKRKNKIAILIVAIVILMGGFYFYVHASVTNALKNVSTGSVAQGRILISAYTNESRVVNYDQNRRLLAYSLLSYSITNTTEANATFDVYSSNPISRIYLLNMSFFCNSCFDENALRNSLLSYLTQYDLIRNSSSFNYVNLSEAAAIPGHSIIIVPSGLMPYSLLSGQPLLLLQLLDRGDTVIYAGLNTTRSLGPNGLIFVNDRSVLSQLNASGVNTSQKTVFPRSGNGTVSLKFRNPTFVFFGGGGRRNYANLTYGTYANLTYVTTGNGTLIAFPNYPTSGWNNAQDMASDIAAVIDARFWMHRLAGTQTLLNLNIRESGSVGMFSNITYANRSAFANRTYSLIRLTASNRQSIASREFSFKNTYPPPGTISIQTVAGESQNIPILLQVGGNNTQNLFLHLDVFDRNSSYVGAIPIGFISSQLGIVKYHAFYFPSGYYLIELKDFNNNYYAGALFYLADLNIVPRLLDFKNGTFVFSVFSNGVPVTNTTYTISLNGAYSTSGAVANGTLTYALPKGTVVNYGDKNFNFNMYNRNYTLSAPYEQTVLNIPAIYIEFGIAIAAVLLLNLILKPPNRDEYYIDVPEFPPSKHEKVKIPQSSVLGIFDKVNYYYRWKYMPLTIDEIKFGINSNIRVANMPISVTVQNASTVLAGLIHGGYVVNAGSYYAPKTWTDASKHDIEYLVIFRKLRDYCVSHAIMFTDLDTDKNADMLVTKNGRQSSIFIYTTSGMKKMNLSNESRTMIVFISEEARQEFLDKLYSSLGREAEILKLGVEYNYVRLIDVNHLEELEL